MAPGDVQIMARAPALPPVLGEAGPARPHPDPLPLAGEGEGPAGAAHGPEVLAVISRTAAQLSRAHQEYVRQSVAAHQQFLALRRAFNLPANPTGLHPLPLAGEGRGEGAGPERPHPSPLPQAGEGEGSRDLPARSYPGPKFDRSQLEVLGSGRISSVLGPAFERQDQHRHQLRIAKPPLLLMDRILGIEGEAGSMGKGRIWSEYTVPADAWYLDDLGRMPVSVGAEAGQANILLMSWLGADWQHQGERLFRFVGCDLKLHGQLPSAGETLRYELGVDGYSQLGETRLFFLRVAGWVGEELRISATMQSGLFAAEDLAKPGSLGWEPASDPRQLEGPCDPPERASTRTAFSAEQVEAFRQGRPLDCFGPGFERAQAHIRTPRLQGGRMQMLDEVEAFDPRGGPWGRGYLRTTRAISPDDWFFAAHFHGDPCMPGFMAIEGVVQSLSFYLAALGFTLERDGWRFDAVTGYDYALRWRGQVTPENKRLVFETFVESVRGGDEPSVLADVVMSVDGRRSFHARRVRLKLSPDFPLAWWRRSGPVQHQLTGERVPLAKLGGLEGYREERQPARLGELSLGYDAVLAMAWGRASQAFGPPYARIDALRRRPRLPGPPFLFISRISQIGAAPGQLTPGSTVETEYDVPEQVWFFEEHAARVMPFAVLLEAMLQPCGWLSSYTAVPVQGEFDHHRLYRNLDGTLTWHAEVTPGMGTLRTKVRLLSAPVVSAMSLFKFEVETWAGQTLVARVQSDFGFFPPEAMANQTGLPVTDAERAQLAAPSDFQVDLTARPARYFSGSLHLPGPMLLMLQRVTGYWPQAGRAGLGRLRAEKDLDPGEWFFKAHFFQDPVQPGSLGLEGLCQLLQFYMLERGLGAGIPGARFESLMLERPVTWKYRGQVVPGNRKVTSELEITEVGHDARGPYAVAEGWLWVDGLRVYHVKNLALRIVPGTGGAS